MSPGREQWVLHEVGEILAGRANLFAERGKERDTEWWKKNLDIHYAHDNCYVSFSPAVLSEEIVAKDCAIERLVDEEKIPLDLDGCLRLYLRTEAMLGDNKIVCGRCSGTSKACSMGGFEGKKRAEIIRSLKYLIVALKKYRFIKDGGMKVIKSSIEFPLASLRVGNGTYTLASFCRHIAFGNSGGHYHEIVRRDKVWFDCNDSLVSEIGGGKLQNAGAYLFVYERAPGEVAE